MGGEMSLLGDIGGLIGSEKAEDAQFAAMQQAALAQEEAFRQAKKQYKPYAQFGQAGMGTLSRLYGFDDGTADMSAFMASPDYQFRLQQGNNAIQGAAAARGGLFSGATGKALTDYNQNTAAQEFDNYVNRLFGVTGIGQQAATGIANAALGKGNKMAGIYQNMGDNQANAIMSQANALGGIGDAVGAGVLGGLYGIPGVTGAAGGAGAKAAIPAGTQGFLSGFLG